MSDNNKQNKPKKHKTATEKRALKVRIMALSLAIIMTLGIVIPFFLR